MVTLNKNLLGGEEIGDKISFLINGDAKNQPTGEIIGIEYTKGSSRQAKMMVKLVK